MERCPYCFKPIPENGICDCHYELSEKAQIEEALHPGSVVGACYQIGAVLGKGGFGITYRGFDLNMQKIVAIKEFFPEGLVSRGGVLTSFPGSGRRNSEVLTLTVKKSDTYHKSLDLFYREAIALGKLDKLPNVVKAHHIFRENGTAYIVMEFVEGKPLKALIAERGTIPESELIPLLDPVLKALDMVHDAGVLHRDIAPDNIMIENDQPTLVDFGAARLEESSSNSLMIGKKGYSSPEQMAGTEQDRRSDIYAIGATYYKALSGIKPQDSMSRMIKDNVVPLHDLNPEISRETSDAVMKAMALNPDDRWNTAGEFRKALKKDPDQKDDIYEQAKRAMGTGTYSGYVTALDLFSQIEGWQDADKLAEICRRKINSKRPTNSGQKTTGSGSKGTSKPKGKPLVWIIPLLILISAGAAGFLLIRSKNDENSARATIAAENALSTLKAIESEQTASVMEAELAEMRQTQAVVNAMGTMTALAGTNEAELMPTQTQKAADLLSTQTVLEQMTQEAVQLIETQQSVKTLEAQAAAQTESALAAEQEAAVRQTQTQVISDIQGTQAALDMHSTGIAQYSTQAAEIHQTETQSALDVIGTAAILEQNTAIALQTEAIYSATQEFENRQTATQTALDSQSTQAVLEQEVMKAILEKISENSTAAAVEFEQTQTQTWNQIQNTQQAIEQQTEQADRALKAEENTAVMELQQTGTQAWTDMRNTQQYFELETAQAVQTEIAAEQTQEADNKAGTETAFAREQIHQMQTETAWSFTQEAIWSAQTEMAEIQNSYFAEKTRLAGDISGNSEQTESGETPVPDQTDTPVPTAEPSLTASYTATNTPEPTLTPTPTASSTPTFTPTITPSPSATATATPTDTPEPTATPIPSDTPIPPTATIPAWKTEPNPVKRGAISGIDANRRGANYLEEKNYDEAVRWFYFAADAGDANAQRNLANCYYYGRGVDKDYTEAVKWYRLSAEQGNEGAQLFLAFRYYNGEGIEQNFEEARKWFEKSAVQGNAAAQYMTGKCYAEGTGVRKNEKTAVIWYRRSAENKNSDGQFALAEAYENGIGNLQKDLTQAAHWYNRSASNGNKEAENNFLRIQNVPLKNDTIVMTSTLNDAVVIRSLPKGTKVKLLGENRIGNNNTWAFIQMDDGIEGWILSSAVAAEL